MKQEHEQLIFEAKKGSQRAFTELSKGLEPMLKKICQKKYSNLSDFEDFMQMARWGVWMAVETYPQFKYKVYINNKTKQLVKSERDNSYKPEYNFFSWLRMCIMHRITREIRRENQKRRKVDVVSLDQEISNFEDGTTLYDKIEEGSTKVEALWSRLKTTVEEEMDSLEAICFQKTVDGYTKNSIVKALKKSNKCTRDDVKEIMHSMRQKIKQGVLEYAK